MACKCLARLDKLLKEELHPEASVAVTFNVKGTTYPYLYAAYPSGRGWKQKVIVPDFCPWCGKRYRKEAKR